MCHEVHKLGDELQDLIDRRQWPERQKPKRVELLAFALYLLAFTLVMHWLFH